MGKDMTIIMTVIVMIIQQHADSGYANMVFKLCPILISYICYAIKTNFC